METLKHISEISTAGEAKKEGKREEGQLGLHTIRYNREKSNSNDQFKTKIIMRKNNKNNYENNDNDNNTNHDD